MNKKMKIAIISLTSCEGCQFALLDQGERFLNWLKKVNLKEFRLLEDATMPDEYYDLVFVEGTPITKENVAWLKKIRQQCHWLIVLGNCAALGGVPEIKNYQGRQKTIREVYQKYQGLENPVIKEVDNFVKVDLVIPGCPITGEEFMDIANQLVKGRLPKLPQQPVCLECQARGYECLLQKGEICLGPIILGGCRAICLGSGQPCWGCRGLVKDNLMVKKVNNLMKKLLSEHPREEINKVLEVFGLRDDVIKKESDK